MDRIYIGNEMFFVENDTGFEWILEDKLGKDAAELFRKYLDDVKFDVDACPGECDRLYQMQEHYERVIDDATEGLRELDVKRADEQKLNLIFQNLRSGRNAPTHSTVKDVLQKIEMAVDLMDRMKDKVLNAAPCPFNPSEFIRALEILKGVL